MKTLVFASRNRGKIVEVEHILNSLLGQDGVKLLNLDDIGYIGEIEETGQTFEENALAKAKMAYLKSGIPSFADDSGLEVDALRGEPGIYSARYAFLNGKGKEGDSQANMDCLLKKMETIENRSAVFICCIGYVGEEQYIVRGECRGEILRYPRGDSGFGYDPLFYVPSCGKTFSQLPRDVKNAISHRGNALQLFARRLKQ